MRKVCVLIIILFASFSIDAQYLVDGEKLDNIQIGKSTIDDVIANYGSDYKLKKHSDYSNALFYEKLGLIFYSCQADPKREIFTIVMQLPFKVQTSKGIILGKSTFKDLFEAYGKWNKTSAGFEYEELGLYFNSDVDVPENVESDNMNFARAEKKAGKANTTVENNSDSKNNNFIGLLNSSVQSNNNYSVSNNNSNQNNQSNNYSINQNKRTNNTVNFSKSNENSTEDKEFKSEIQEWGNKTVKGIEIFEKGRLRQCYTDFRIQE